MNDSEAAWARELERRISIYDDIEASGRFPGQLSLMDYLAMGALVLTLTIGFWAWSH